MTTPTNLQQGWNHWLRLGIPCCCGVVASVFNYIALRDKLTPAAYCVVNRTIEAGETIISQDLSRIEITGGTDFMRFAVPYEEVRAFVGSSASLRIEKQSVLLWQHLDRGIAYKPSKGEIEVGLEGKQLDGVDAPELITSGDRTVLHVEETGGKTKELGPFVVSSATYKKMEGGKSQLTQIKFFARQNTRSFYDIMKVKRNQGMRLFNVSRATSS